MTAARKKKPAEKPEKPVAGEVLEAPMPEAAEAVEDFIPAAADLVVHDPQDRHEAMVVLDAHDVAAIVQHAQSSALKKWVYALPTGETGLSIDGVEDIVQQMNWTGKARISTLPETLHVERITEDLGNGGPEPLWSATIFAVDEVTGEKLPGSSMEPVNMRLTETTAAKWRKKGKQVPEDRRVFDIFSRQKAIQKAVRNALDGFIPEELEQAIIGMYANDPSRVERIQTAAESKVADLPAPLTDDRAKALIAECEGIYDEIRELGEGQGKVKFPPGTFSAWMLQSQHDHGALERFVAYLKQRREEIPGELLREAQEREAIDTAVKVACPKCEAPPSKFCKGVRGSHGERVRARLEQIQAAAS